MQQSGCYNQLLTTGVAHNRKTARKAVASDLVEKKLAQYLKLDETKFNMLNLRQVVEKQRKQLTQRHLN